MADAARTVDLRGSTIPYDVRHSTRAERSRITVDAGGVTVVVPEGAVVEPEHILQNHTDWVLARHEELEAYRDRIPDRRFEAGASFPYLGEPHEVVVETRPYSVVDDGTLRLAAHHVAETSVKRALETLYRRRARERFESLVEEYATRMDVEYGRIEVRNQRTKWGSCSTSGTISLNWRLLLGPPKVSKYVVIHELAHRREMNHSEAFWSLVADHDPAYERHRTWLSEHATRLVFDPDDL